MYVRIGCSVWVGRSRYVVIKFNMPRWLKDNVPSRTFHATENITNALDVCQGRRECSGNDAKNATYLSCRSIRSSPMSIRRKIATRGLRGTCPRSGTGLGRMGCRRPRSKCPRSRRGRCIGTGQGRCFRRFRRSGTARGFHSSLNLQKENMLEIE